MDRRYLATVCAIASTWAGTAAAEIAPRALARVARTAESRCTGPLCQNVNDTEPAPPASSSDEPPPFSLALGVGAAWLRTRGQRDLGQDDLRPVLSDSFGDGGADGALIDEGNGFVPLDPSDGDDRRSTYPTLSLTLDLQQPLASIGALDLRLAERFSCAVAASVSSDDESLFAGFADIVLGAHSARFPVQVGVGPSLGFLDGQDQLFGWEDPVLIGVVGVVRVQLPGVPGTLDAVARGTRLLASSAETGSYRDVELALTLPL